MVLRYCLACLRLRTQEPSFCVGFCMAHGFYKHTLYHNCAQYSPIPEERLPNVVEWYNRRAETNLSRAGHLEEYMVQEGIPA